MRSSARNRGYADEGKNRNAARCAFWLELRLLFRGEAWVRSAGERLRPFSTGGNYVNFQTADESEARIRASYGANFERLVRAKRRYDPENLFRSSRNIDPAPRAA